MIELSWIKFSPQFLEAVNGVLVVILSSIEIVFAVYILREMKHCISKQGWVRGLRSGYLHRRAAISCFIFFFGDLIIRITVWFYRHAAAAGHPLPETAATLFTTLGVMMCILGGVCILRHFIPKQDSHWAWIAMIFAALLFGIGTAL